MERTRGDTGCCQYRRVAHARVLPTPEPSVRGFTIATVPWKTSD